MAVKARPFDVRHEPEDRYDIGWTETRWRLVDEDTGEIVDDAQAGGTKRRGTPTAPTPTKGSRKAGGARPRPSNAA